MSDSPLANEPRSVLSEVTRRLRQTEQHAATVIGTLERHISIQDSLSDTSKGLAESNSLIAEFAQESKRAIEELAKISSALQSAVALLQTANIAAFSLKLEEIDRCVQGIEIEVKSLRSRLDTELKELRSSINANADRVIERLRPRSIREGFFGRLKG